MAKTKTHFEQVPLTDVEKLVRTAEIAAGKKKPITAGNVIIETSATKTEPYSVRKTV